ncbi:MAG: nicotinamide mononucleotide transporter [Firmicutes bacterium]|nr:nicotinamide mononucleotide transporter [Bacillota bacterium]
MKNYIKSWNKFEIILLVLSVVVILGLGIYLECGFLATIVPFIGFFSALNQAKGHVVGQVVGVLLAILYSIMSYNNQYYGEVIIYLVVILPLYISGIYTWLKNRDNKSEKVKQNVIETKEWHGLLLVNILLYVGLFFLLKHFNTSNLLVSTISMNINLTATYLLVRRSRYSFLFYLINAFILLILWGLPVLNGNILLLPMVFDAVLLLINNLYGLHSWSKSK